MSSLRSIGKEAFGAAVRWSGAPLLVRLTYARRKVGILLYHDPTPTRLEQHLHYLSRRYDFITLEQLVDAIVRSDWSAIVRTSLVVTLDDGHRTNIELVDTFRRYGVVPTLYVCTATVKGNGLFWFRQAGLDPEPLKRVTQSRRLELVGELSGGERQALTVDELRAMAQHVHIESHTLTHPILTMMDDVDCELEIGRARLEVEEIIGAPCSHFSYPNGDYGTREVELVRKHGYRSARTADIGWTSVGSDVFRLKITAMPDHASVNVLAAHLAGALHVKHLVLRLLALLRRRTTG